MNRGRPFKALSLLSLGCGLARIVNICSKYLSTATSLMRGLVKEFIAKIMPRSFHVKLE